MMAASDRQVWALLPVRGFSSAKTRLGSALNAAERSELARAMLSDVLAVLTRSPAVAGILLVSGDREVARFGANYGVVTLMEPAAAGTNAAVQLGLDHLKSVGAGPCVIVQSDIPCLSDAEFARVVDALRRTPVVIVPASRDRGTNMLALSRPDIIVPSFGERSFERHMMTAADLDLDIAVLELPGAGHDIDMPADLYSLPDCDTGIHTRTVLRRLLSHAGNGALQ